MSTDKRNFEEKNLKDVKIGILGLVSRKGGGVFQYTCSLIEALIGCSKYKQNLFIIKSKELGTQNLNSCENLIELNTESSNLTLKILKALYIKIPSIRNILDVSGDYKIIKDSINLVINPIISLIPVYLNKPYIVTIHDLQHKYYPQFFTFKQRLSRNFVYKNVAKSAVLVVCESNFVKNDIIKFLDILPDKIRVIPSPPPSYLVKIKIQEEYSKEMKSKHSLPERFLFYPAQFWRNKNHINLLKAISLVKKRYRENVSLVLVGSKKNNFENTVNEIRKLNLEDQIKYLGYASDKDIPSLYKLSTALVVPTFFESVSMPIWEAFYLGTPVISSNVCALPEQIGDAGLLFNPNDIGDMAEKIYKMWIDENLRQELIKKGYWRARDLTLENYAEQWEKIIDEAIEIIKRKG